MKNLAPICLFTYNRLEETKKTIAALKKNKLASQTHLIVFSDGPKNKKEEFKVEQVRTFLKTIIGFKKITYTYSENNKGLASSIINGVSQTLKQHENIIVLEDDLMTTPNFITFMNLALNYYESISNIQSINGYSLLLDNDGDVYFQRRTFPWGWATWSNRWEKKYLTMKE